MAGQPNFAQKKTRRKRASEESIQLAEQVFQATVGGHLNQVIKPDAAGVSADPALYAGLSEEQPSPAVEALCLW